MAPKIPKKKLPEELYQQGVVSLRPSDQLCVMQNGVEKWLLISSLLDAMQGMIATLVPAMAVSAHTHPESDVTNLGTDITSILVAIAGKAAASHAHSESDVSNLSTDLASLFASVDALVTSLAGKAPLVHTHLIGDIKSNFVDASSGNAITYDGTFYSTAKATVAAGNAVFQFTANGLAAGAAIFPSGPLPNSELFRGEEGANPIATGVAVWSNGNKTLTVPVSRTGAALTILGLSVLGATVPANGTVVYATARGR